MNTTPIFLNKSAPQSGAFQPAPIRLPGNHFTLWTRSASGRVDFEPFYNGGPFNARAAYAWHWVGDRREIAFTMYRDGGLYISEFRNSYDPS